MKTIAAAAALAALFAFPVMAQQGCVPFVALKETLAETHGESVIAWGQTPAGTFFQLWGNRETGTWTFFETDGNRACLRGAGGTLVTFEAVKKPNL